MRITVIAIDQDQPALVSGTSALGWRGRFGCPLVVGEAIFIPMRGQEDNLRTGNTISAQTGHEAVSSFSIVEAAADSMRPLESPGDYVVRGRVVHVAPEGVVRVSVRGLIFTIERAELSPCQPETGDTVEFSLHGLSLWDDTTS